MDDGLIRVMDILGVNSLTHWQAEDGRHAYRVKHVVEYDAAPIADPEALAKRIKARLSRG